MNKRVLVVNKFFYNRGGAEVVAIAMCQALREMGYSVAVFTMDFKENFKNEECYVASNVSFNTGVVEKIRFAGRTLGRGNVKTDFLKALNEFKPDIVHFHNIHSYLSPAIVKVAKDFGCRVVWTLHDYKLLCPSYACLRDNKPCELCFKDKINVIKNRCMKGSLAASALAYIEAKRWSRDWIQRYVDAFVCPSSFMAKKMEQGGFDKSKLHVICNFIDPVKYEILKGGKQQLREDIYVYVGRLSQEKGVKTLLDVASRLPYKLYVAGDGPLADELKCKYAGCQQIVFLGRQSAQQVSELLAKSHFTVAPSECYENNPLSVIESLCAGTPVVGANIGGIPELIEERWGYVYESGNSEQLAAVIRMTFEKKFNNEEIAKAALCRFSSEHHISLLEKLYQ